MGSFRQIQFTHVLVSYSNQSIVPIDDLVELAKNLLLMAKYMSNQMNIEYATNNSSHKGKGKIKKR